MEHMTATLTIDTVRGDNSIQQDHVMKAEIDTPQGRVTVTLQGNQLSIRIGEPTVFTLRLESGGVLTINHSGFGEGATAILPRAGNEFQVSRVPFVTIEEAEQYIAARVAPAGGL